METHQVRMEASKEIQAHQALVLNKQMAQEGLKDRERASDSLIISWQWINNK
jgi:hypothetical protein